MDREPIGNNHHVAGRDDRWGSHTPWFIRHSETPSVGDFDTFFSRVSQRLHRLMNFNEGEIVNQDHFGARIETDSLQKYNHVVGRPLGEQLKYFFDVGNIRQIANATMAADAEERHIIQILSGTPTPFPAPMHAQPESEELRSARSTAEENRPVRFKKHFSRVALGRLGVLETILVDLHKVGVSERALNELITDLRRAFAETGIPLDIRGTPPAIIPMDDSLLQREVIDPALARIRKRWPERADELLSAYHDILAGRRLDEVFGSAFKSLEEIARALTGEPTFDLSARALQRHFPDLHPTVQLTIDKLRAHRGDAAGHGRKAPTPEEIRYLLFHICNTAMLLLDMDPASAAQVSNRLRTPVSEQ